MKPNLLLCLLNTFNKTFIPNERTQNGKPGSKKALGFKSAAFLTIFIVLAFSQQSYSQTNTWNGSSSANWNTGANWSLNHVPLAAEDVVIPNGITATIAVNTAAVCKTFTMNGGGTSNTVSINGGQSLTVTNAVSIAAGTSGGVQKILAVGTGTLSCASISLAATSNNNRDCEVTLSSGTVNVTGDITMDGTSARNAIRFTGAGTLNLGGNFLGIGGGILVPSTGTVNCDGANAQTISGANTTSFYNLTINKSASANTVTGTTNAFTVANNLTVTQGNLILQATNANYTVTNDVNIAANGTITHSVDWNATGKLLSVGGSFVITGGLFTYTVRSHVQMTSAATENISTGSNASSAFSILTLTNGTFNANGDLRVNDNFWAMFNTAGSFHTNGQTVYANGSLLSSGGTCFIDGGTLNVTGGFQVGSGTNGTVTFSSGTLNSDLLTLGLGAFTGAFNHTGGTSNLSNNLVITGTGTYTCTGSPAINIAGDWTNNKGNAGFVPATSTVTFNSTTAAQNINGSSAAQTFNNITVNKSGQQLNVAGSTTSLTLNGSMVLTAGTFVAGTATAINVGGNWTNNGTAFTAGSGTVTFNGGSAQTISGSTITSFNNVALSNTNGISLTSIDVNITGGAGALSFTNGKITTGSNKVILGTAGTITGAGAGKYIYGNLQMGIATGSPTGVFEIGDAAAYAPISVVFNSVTVSGNVTAYTVGTEHPSILSSTIDESKSVNRYWSMANSGMSLSSYSPTFNWVAADVDAGATTANFIIGRRTSSWSYPTMGTRNPTNCTTTLSSFGTYACGEGGAAVPTIATQPLDQAVCSGSSLSYVAAANNKPASTVVWEISTDNGSTFSTLTIASPYSVSTSTVSGVTTSTLTINPVTPGMDQYSYRAVFTNSRGTVTSFDGLLTVNISPTANAGSALSPICGSVASAPLGGSVGGSATGGTWSTPSGGTFTPNATTLNATWTPPGGFTGTATLTLTSSGGSCGSATDSKTQVVSGSAGAITITPSSASICVNAIQSLAASNSETSTSSSGTVNVAIPDNSNAGASNTIAVAGIPTGATVTGVSVTLNVTHAKDGDLILNLRAPNGNVLNLFNRQGGTGTNLTNTIVSSTGVTAFSAGTAPFTATFKADGTNAIGATGQTSNVTTFASLYSTANGNWVFSAKDAAASNTGTINSWSITLTYIDPVTWSPVTYLYSNAAATTPYVAGQAFATVYAKPTASGTTTYTATATNSGGCTSTQTVAVTAGPVVTVTPDYCYGGGYIQLSASSSPAATSWLWSTGATTSSILVNVAGNYTVTATTGGGCVSSVTAPIAQELVVNGDFSSGNTGFTSSYGFVNYTSGCMYPEGIYTVGNNPNFTHSYFFGKDHTTNSGNLLIVNGSGSPVSVWQQTITVQPNTTYYFSAWAMSLNDASPFAQLQFDINGSGIGTTAVLPAGPNSTVAPYAWVQFYGSWTSGSGVTSAVVSIKDLQTALGGNDFGLDDISFGTLTSFVSLTSSAGTDNQTVCNNTAITNIVYTIGSGSGGPSVTGLPSGVSYSFTGTTLTISGTPTSAGTYSYTVTTSACNPVTKTGVITVQDETISLSSASGTNAQTPCLSSAITNITYAIAGLATGATVSGLPAGVTGSYSAGVFTISGTPTASGNFTYTVTTTGTCIHVTATGTMNVRRQIITRTSAAGTNAQTVCINTAITNITYSVGGTATGAGVTGLPAGVSGSFSAGVFTISGTPTVGGVFSYTVTTTGTCASVTAAGTVTVNTQTISLSSGVGTNAQSICNNTAITTITYTVGGTATGASVSGLPPGVSGSYSAGVFTISGTATAIGVYNYTVTTSGTCSPAATATGTITVGQQTIGLTSASGTDAQTLCISTAITNITYAIGGMGTGAGVSGLPAGVSGSYSAGVYTISGTPTAFGTFNYTVTTSGSCSSSATANGSITVSPASVGGTIASASICYSGSGSLSLTGNTGTVVRWEISTDGTTWTNISNTTTTQSYTSLTQTTWYRALVQSGACASTAYSNSAQVGIHNLWTGATSSDWNTGSNWSDGLTPTTSCPDVTIPLLTSPNVYPQLTSGTATINNLIIYPSATMSISNATLQVAGTITNSGTLIASNGTIELNGTSAAQTIAGSMFSTHTIQNLIISNSNGVSFSNTNDTVKITGSLNFGTGSAVLNTNDNLTLISDASGTASVGDLTNGGVYSGNDIIGNVTVERYIPVHPKAWQFLATPTNGQSINNAWQEGNTPLSNATHPGYGTIITGQMTGAVALGFDVYTPSGPSMKTFNSTTNGWDGVASPSIQIANKKGYMFFVRGDRSVTTSSAPATATVLRTTGRLFTTGAYAPSTTTITAGKFESVGNPYASAIDFRLISKPASPAVDDVFYVWDPLLTNNYNGLGGYQTISAANSWKPIPGGTANYDVNIAYPYIQSGQAFLMHATGSGGTVSFGESNKVSQYSMANRPAARVTDRQFLRLSLYTNGMLSDGNVVAFDSDFSNGYDADDALKNPNSNENFGIKKDDKILALEARSPVVTEDTVFYTFSNLRKPTYQLSFNPENMAAGLTAILVDKFLNTTTAISTTDTSSYDFAITTTAGSYAADRFYLVFRQAPPAAITSITATRNIVNGPVNVDWTVAHEAGVLHYEIQRSATGNNFISITDMDPIGNNCGTYSYDMIDQSPLRGTNYYRIKGLKNNNTEIYSAIVKLVPGKDQLAGKGTPETKDAANNNIEVATINLYPNPVTDKMVNVQFINQSGGVYKLELSNQLGETVFRKTAQVKSNGMIETLHLDRSIAAGNYQLKITAPDNTIIVKQVIIQ